MVTDRMRVFVHGQMLRDGYRQIRSAKYGEEMPVYMKGKTVVTLEEVVEKFNRFVNKNKRRKNNE